MKKTISALIITLTLLVTPLYSQNNIQKFINKKMKTDTLFTDAVVGILAIGANGKTIAEWNPDAPLLTASTLKTITTGLSLKVLGDNYKFSTKIASSGEIKDSILKGNLYIIGGGDPTLGSRDTVAYKLDSLFSIWKDGLKLAGIKKIEGSVIADDRFLTNEMIPDSWSWGNIGVYYGSGTSGLPFCENAQYFTILPGKNIGDTVSIIDSYPYIPNMVYQNETTTAAEQSGDRSSYFVSDLSQVGNFRGTIAIDRDTVTMDASNKFAPLSCAWYFNQFLLNSGIEVAAEPQTITPNNDFCPDSVKLLAETFSPELKEIVNVTNRISNNFYAETLLKTIGKELTGVGSYDSSIVAVERLLQEMQIPLNGFDIVDGSGLSRQDFISPRFFCNYYTKMEEIDNFATFFNSFPVAGASGTLKNVLTNEDKELKSKIHAKSGSLSGVRCYAGYVDSKKGKIKFAILVNNYSNRTSKLQVKIEGFLKEMALYKR